MDIKNGNQICDDETIISATKDFISIETEEDKIKHYMDSVNEIREDLSEEEWMLFSYILSFEMAEQERVNSTRECNEEDETYEND